MNDLTIHDGLTDASIRDAITDGLNETYFNKTKVEVPKYPHRGSVTDNIMWSIAEKQCKIANIEYEIDNDKKRLALITLMKLKDWKEHDVSDVIPRCGEYHRSFIGTEEEYNNLINKYKTI